MANRQAITTDNAPVPAGPYSQGISVAASSRIVFAAGQLPLDPTSGEIEEKDVAGQTRVALSNAIAVVEAAGGSVADLVKVTLFVRDISEAGVISAAYEELLEKPYPARTTVEVSGLPRGALIEVDAIAAVSAG